ncbi:MAG: DUF3151 domain-containing protein [Galactobacter sp.]|uniref:DUF3151 domain-containing protein n=1 Tax=Galactobacter sp. TaxID=2676125 RepID=UPI0025BE7316|nr:DUF3151 domain-containing protein [Galactobacter sp.]
MNLGENLLGIPATLLPENPDLVSRYDAGDEAEDLARAFPAESLPWALMADDAWAEGREVESYAFARVGYHRGLDALRKSGWRGQGPVPYSHEPNRGFLRSLYALRRAAAAIGEVDEVARIGTFLNDSDPKAVGAIEG